MNDTHADHGLPADINETLSESNRTESCVPVATSTQTASPQTNGSNGSSPRKIEANRRNAKMSTGPKTARGKSISSWNSTRHGLLAKRLPELYGQNKEHFARLLRNLRQDLQPVGILEEVLVEKIAREYWRLAVAAWHEAQEISSTNPFVKRSFEMVFRYQTAINRQLFQAMNQLERVQRLRRGDNVPAPIALQVALEPATVSGGKGG